MYVRFGTVQDELLHKRLFWSHFIDGCGWGGLHHIFVIHRLNETSIVMIANQKGEMGRRLSKLGDMSWVHPGRKLFRI